MILSNVEIHSALDCKRLILDPEPGPRFHGSGGPALACLSISPPRPCIPAGTGPSPWK
jgi:hypothetical protein